MWARASRSCGRGTGSDNSYVWGHEPRGDSRPRLSGRAQLDECGLMIVARRYCRCPYSGALLSRGRLSPHGSCRVPHERDARAYISFAESRELKADSAFRGPMKYCRFQKDDKAYYGLVESVAG